MSDRRPVGVFDSGIGGLTVLREALRQHPSESFVYLADDREAPYGTKPVDALRARCARVVEFLLGRDVKAVLVACNTASVAALPDLRARFSVPFVGIVPGVKPAAELTRTGTVGVLATAATATSEPLAQLIRTHAHGVRVITGMCPELVDLTEQGLVDGPAGEDAVERHVRPILDEGADVLVLGCTHLGFFESLLARACGPGVRLVNPCDAVARQLGRVLDEKGLRSEGPTAEPVYLATGSPERLRAGVIRLFGSDLDDIIRVRL